MLTAPTLAELVNFVGANESDYTSFATEALEQATNLLELNTGISEWPTDTLQLKIAKRGVCQLADYLHEANKYRRVRARPFASETVMDRSYTIARAQSGEPTGLLWWDKAVELLTVADSSDISSGGVIIFDNDGIIVRSDGELTVPGPVGEESTYQHGYIVGGYYPPATSNGTI
jgi:hypothetical protein